MALPSYVRAAADGVVLHAFVQPGAAKTALAGVHGTALKVKVTALATGGKANRAVEVFVAELLGIPAAKVRVVRGHASRHKQVRIEAESAEIVAVALGAALSSRGHVARKETGRQEDRGRGRRPVGDTAGHPGQDGREEDRRARSAQEEDDGEKVARPHQPRG